MGSFFDVFIKSPLFFYSLNLSIILSTSLLSYFYPMHSNTLSSHICLLETLILLAYSIEVKITAYEPDGIYFVISKACYILL